MHWKTHMEKDLIEHLQCQKTQNNSSYQIFRRRQCQRHWNIGHIVYLKSSPSSWIEIKPEIRYVVKLKSLRNFTSDWIQVKTKLLSASLGYPFCAMIKGGLLNKMSPYILCDKKKEGGTTQTADEMLLSHCFVWKILQILISWLICRFPMVRWNWYDLMI